jgi:hypothetical protein
MTHPGGPTSAPVIPAKAAAVGTSSIAGRRGRVALPYGHGRELS